MIPAESEFSRTVRMADINASEPPGSDIVVLSVRGQPGSVRGQPGSVRGQPGSVRGQPGSGGPTSNGSSLSSDLVVNPKSSVEQNGSGFQSSSTTSDIVVSPGQDPSSSFSSKGSDNMADSKLSAGPTDNQRGGTRSTYKSMSSSRSSNADMPQPLSISKNMMRSGGSSLSSDIVVISPSMATEASGVPASLSHLQISLASFSQDMSLEETWERFQQIFNENLELRDTIEQSNASMKKVEDRILNMMNQRDQEREEMREKHQQVREVVLGLQRELAEKEAIIAEMTARAGTKEMTSSLDANGYEVIETQTSQDELSHLTQEISHLKDKAQRDAQCHQREVDKLREQLREVNMEKSNRELSMEKVREGMKKLKDRSDRLEVEKRDLIAMNNELCAKASLLSVPDDEVKVYKEKSHDLTVKTEKEVVLSGGEVRHHSEGMVSDLLIQLQEERRKVTDLGKEVSVLGSQKESLEKQLAQTEEELSIVNSRLQTTVSHLTQQHTLKQDELLQQLDQLTQELNDTRSQQVNEPHLASLKQQVMTLIQDLQASESKFGSASKAIDNYKDRCKTLQAKLEMCQSDLDTQRNQDDQLILALRNTIVDLEKTTADQKVQTKRITDDRDQLKSSYEQLFRDYHDFMEKRTKDADSQRRGLGGSDRRQFEEKVDTLTAQLVSAEEAIQAKEVLLSEMKSHIIKLQADVETIPILKAQAEVFRLDFEAERNARQAKHHEKEQLVDEVRQLQLQVQQLQDEIQSLSAVQFNEMQRRHGHSQQDLRNIPASPRPGYSPGRGYAYPMGQEGPDNMEAPQGVDTIDLTADQNQTSVMQPPNITQPPQMPVEEPIKYECPICQLVCPDHDTLQIHVEHCLTD